MLDTQDVRRGTKYNNKSTECPMLRSSLPPNMGCYFSTITDATSPQASNFHDYTSSVISAQ